jgi:hypothetical protein
MRAAIVGSGFALVVTGAGGAAVVLVPSSRIDIPGPDALDAIGAVWAEVCSIFVVPTPFLKTARVPAATTSTVAAIRHTIGSTRFAGAATGITPRGALSSAVRIRDDAAMNPRASATAAAHCGHSFTCASTRAASSALSAPSSHE